MESVIVKSSEEKKETGERTLLEGFFVYLSIIVRSRILIITITITAFAVSLIFAVISLTLPPQVSPLPNQYRATATLLLTADSGGSMMASLLASLGVAAPGGSSSLNYGQLAVQVLQSRTVLDKIIGDNGLIEKYHLQESSRSDARELAASKMEISFNPALSILTIGVVDIDPEFAARMANSITDTLLAWFSARGGISRLNTIQSLEQKITEVERESSRLQTQIREFQEAHGVLTVDEMAQTQSEMLQQLQVSFVQTEMRIRTQSRFSLMENDPELARLRAERDNIAQMIREIEGGYSAGRRQLPSRDELPRLAMEFARLRMELEVQQRIHNALAEQYEVARLSADAEPVFTVIERAEPPDKKSGPSRVRMILTATAAAFAFSVCLAFLLHFRTRVSQYARLMGKLKQ